MLEIQTLRSKNFGLMAPAGINGGDEAVRNGAAQDDLFAALLYQHPLAC
jgi:hypothetical protein